MPAWNSLGFATFLMGGIAQDAAFFRAETPVCRHIPSVFTWEMHQIAESVPLQRAEGAPILPTKISVQGEAKSLTGGDVPRCTKQQGEVRDPGRLQIGGPMAAAPQPVRLIW